MPTPPPTLLDDAREGLRARHYAFRTEQSSIDWMRRCILFPQKRHPHEPAYLTPGLEGIRTRNTSAVQVWHPGGYQTNPEGATHKQQPGSIHADRGEAAQSFGVTVKEQMRMKPRG
jgi:hypothetical protein